MSLITVNNLSKTYDSIRAVDGISFAVQEGEIFGILGPNGAGKTTTMECVLGLREPDSGLIQVLSLNPVADRNKLFKKIGVQLQETSYQDKIKVYELCELFQGLYHDPYPYQELLKRFKLVDKSKVYINKLSGGQKQKLSIILALIANPQLMFLDELTTGLDPGARRRMWSYLRDLKGEGRTIVMTTHYMEEAEFLCDRIAILSEGRIKAIGSVAEVIAMANIDIEVSFRTEQNIISSLEVKLQNSTIEQQGKLVKIFSREDNILVRTIKALEEEGIKYNNIDIRRPRLEDAFLKLTGMRLED